MSMNNTISASTNAILSAHRAIWTVLITGQFWRAGLAEPKNDPFRALVKPPPLVASRFCSAFEPTSDTVNDDNEQND